jgi:hypothetical protein
MNDLNSKMDEVRKEAARVDLCFCPDNYAVLLEQICLDYGIFEPGGSMDGLADLRKGWRASVSHRENSRDDVIEETYDARNTPEEALELLLQQLRELPTVRDMEP